MATTKGLMGAQNAWNKLQATAASQNRPITKEEFRGIGGSPNEYRAYQAGTLPQVGSVGARGSQYARGQAALTQPSAVSQQLATAAMPPMAPMAPPTYNPFTLSQFTALQNTGPRGYGLLNQGMVTNQMQPYSPQIPTQNTSRFQQGIPSGQMNQMQPYNSQVVTQNPMNYQQNITPYKRW